jgi:hypothetical protein
MGEKKAGVVYRIARGRQEAKLFLAATRWTAPLLIDAAPAPYVRPQVPSSLFFELMVPFY